MTDDTTKDPGSPGSPGDPAASESLDEQDLDSAAGGVAGDYPSGDGSASAGTAAGLFSHSDHQRILAEREKNLKSGG